MLSTNTGSSCSSSESDTVQEEHELEREPLGSGEESGDTTGMAREGITNFSRVGVGETIHPRVLSEIMANSSSASSSS